ncbi:putative signal-transduction protein with CBS domains [Erythrobacter sp. NAP1]|uniref:CBS domain-containing protein n=1 Tax=Erythrobacter sp. NAP1 TaxID=237727 RepID=UPI000068518A|nr:CBS domain-containing protein [Erythrobacter sp. NAP1]EAQ27886.1 putative signal-transduction protein with CBS domains [Erythrobacter sp. NAP1]
MRIADRTEFASKAPPLTCTPDTIVFDAVTQMAEKNFGSIFVTDPDNRVLGVMTERDIFRRVIGASRDPKTTPVSEVMTTEVRAAHKDDQILDWMQIMSNERFRRLPIVDEDKRLIAVMSQGDFVGYTWPQLLGQVGQMAQATLGPRFNQLAIAGGIAVYTIILVIVLLYATR